MKNGNYAKFRRNINIHQHNFIMKKIIFGILSLIIMMFTIELKAVGVAPLKHQQRHNLR